MTGGALLPPPLLGVSWSWGGAETKGSGGSLQPGKATQGVQCPLLAGGHHRWAPGLRWDRQPHTVASIGSGSGNAECDPCVPGPQGPDVGRLGSQSLGTEPL